MKKLPPPRRVMRQSAWDSNAARTAAIYADLAIYKLKFARHDIEVAERLVPGTLYTVLCLVNEALATAEQLFPSITPPIRKTA